MEVGKFSSGQLLPLGSAAEFMITPAPSCGDSPSLSCLYHTSAVSEGKLDWRKTAFDPTCVCPPNSG